MSLAYVKPGVAVSEIVSPSFSPLLLDPTSICIIGPAQGYEDHVEVFVLDDQISVQLRALNADKSTLVVRDASNITLTPFVASTALAEEDYAIDDSELALSGVLKIARAMQTTIEDAEEVVVYFENSAAPAQGDGKTETLTLNKTTPSAPVNRAADTQAASITVSKAGLAPAGDYTVAGSGGATPTIVWNGGATVLKKYQKVYLSYLVGTTQFVDAEFQLNNLTTVALPATAASIVVKTAPGAPATAAVAYAKGTTTDLDFIVGGTGATTTIARSAGTTTMGVAQDKLAVRVTYRATPSVYWQPTRCFSQSDVEEKFGPAFDAVGNVKNPVSFASALAFENGASSVIVQALFTEGSPRTAPTGSVTDWENTLKNLRDIEDINVIVPLISAGGLTTTDAQNLQILQKVQDHINFMAVQQNQLVLTICGEDSTGGSLANRQTLRDHALALRVRPQPDAVVLLTPSAFPFANPVTGRESLMGGQYEAACVAGMLARYPVQMPLTRKRVNGTTGVKDFVPASESEKDEDANSGLTVIEAKRGRVQVRHAITTANDSLNRRELNVIRAKHYMMENIRESIDTEVIGHIVLDPQANFRVQLIVTAVLERLVQEGAIVSYRDIQARRDPNDATAMQVRFSYLPAYPLNLVSISFSIDSTQGVTFDTADAANVQGI